jgi:hypothetical protein
MGQIEYIILEFDRNFKLALSPYYHMTYIYFIVIIHASSFPYRPETEQWQRYQLFATTKQQNLV